MDAGELRERLMDAALPLFVERGVRATTPTDVAAAAGVSEVEAATVFPGLDALANTIYRHWKVSLTQAILAEGPPSADPREQFRVFWYRGADFAAVNPYATRFLRTERYASWHDEQTAALEHQVHQMLVAFFGNLRGDRLVRDESPELLAALVLGAFDGMFEAGRAGQLVLTDETIAAAERAVWAAIRK